MFFVLVQLPKSVFEFCTSSFDKTELNEGARAENNKVRMAKIMGTNSKIITQTHVLMNTIENGSGDVSGREGTGLYSSKANGKGKRAIISSCKCVNARISLQAVRAGTDAGMSTNIDGEM